MGREGHSSQPARIVQQETGDYPAAAASYRQALALFSDPGNLLGYSEALNRLGELSLRTSATEQAHRTAAIPGTGRGRYR